MVEFRAAVTNRKKLFESDPASVPWRTGLALDYKLLGDTLSQLKDFRGAAQNYNAAIQVQEGLVRKDPSNVVWQRQLAIANLKRGDASTARIEGSSGASRVFTVHQSCANSLSHSGRHSSENRKRSQGRLGAVLQPLRRQAQDRRCSRSTKQVRGRDGSISISIGGSGTGRSHRARWKLAEQTICCAGAGRQFSGSESKRRPRGT